MSRNNSSKSPRTRIMKNLHQINIVNLSIEIVEGFCLFLYNSRVFSKILQQYTVRYFNEIVVFFICVLLCYWCSEIWNEIASVGLVSSVEFIGELTF